VFDLARAWTRPLAFALLASCAGDDSRHVYESSPPVRAVAAPTIVPAAAELPIGAGGPTARVAAVRLTATGAPAPLDRLSESVDVVTVVSRGRGSSPQGPARLELHLTGVIDTTFVERLDTPVPMIVAHSFRVPVNEGSTGLPSGRYQLQVRLVGPSGRAVAASVPVFIGVQER
jgi:thiazole synthase ThiGH ThiG subunit